MSGSPLPEIDVTSAEFWSGVESGELRLTRCEACGRASFPPLPTCPHCGSDQVHTVLGSGRGLLYSWVVVRVALDPEFEADVPYTVVAVDLEEGGRMLGRLLGSAELEPGRQMTFEVFSREGVRLPGFRAAI